MGLWGLEIQKGIQNGMNVKNAICENKSNHSWGEKRILKWEPR